jgi:predicted phosphodiesterase
MRVGLLSDVHANLFALRSALTRLRSEGVDTWVCAGDLIGYGPHPNECVETIAALDPICVVGNHELLLLEAISDEQAGRRALQSLEWTRGVLRPDIRSYLAELPRTAEAPGIVVSHGSLSDPEEYVRSAIQAAAQLERLAAEHSDKQVLVLGHTHRQWLFGADQGTIFPSPDAGHPDGFRGALAPGERFLVNPGSVGQSRDRERAPRARFGLVDLDRADVRFFAEPYDAAACRAALRERGLPVDSAHLRPGYAAAASRRVRRLLQRKPTLPRSVG